MGGLLSMVYNKILSLCAAEINPFFIRFISIYIFSLSHHTFYDVFSLFRYIFYNEFLLFYDFSHIPPACPKEKATTSGRFSLNITHISSLNPCSIPAHIISVRGFHVHPEDTAGIAVVPLVLPGDPAGSHVTGAIEEIPFAVDQLEAVVGIATAGVLEPPAALV